MAKKHVQSDRALQWQQRVAAWARSGLSQSEYCRRSGIALPTFNYWVRREQKRQPARQPRRQLPASAPSFLPVRVMAPDGVARGANCSNESPLLFGHDESGWAISVQLRNGRILRVTDRMAPEVLGRFATALEGVAPSC